VYRRFAAAAVEAGVVPLFGLEIIALIDDLPGGGSLINDRRISTGCTCAERR